MAKPTLTRKLALFVLSLAAVNVQAKWNDVDVKTLPFVAVPRETVAGKAQSLLPPGKRWKLVWHDEFDQKEIDKTKWMCRESFWGADFPAFAHDFKGVEMTGETVKLNLFCKDGQYSSPHLQTGSLTYDIPKDSKGFWPFGKYRKPLFMHKYGYYEIRCRQPKHPGWHSAFWLQAPGIGSSSDPAQCGVETDIMENYRQHKDGKIVGGNGWNGYGADSRWFGHFAWDYEEYEDGWCHYGVDWTPDGYTFYANGKKIGEQNSPVSHVEQFILVSTEPRGYRQAGNDGGLSDGRREWGRPDPDLEKIPLPDTFEVDFVRVYDAEPLDSSHACRMDVPAVDADVRQGWARMMREYYWEPTSLIYSCRPEDVQKADFYVNGFKVWEKRGDYGYGLEDCAIMCGVGLSGLCDQYLVTNDKSLAADARKLAQGLVNLATVHGVKGFVARGICVEDGKSVCALSSIDQHTHFMHGLWRYWHSPLLDDSLKPDIVRVVSEVADRMAEQVVEANDWSFQQAVGHGTTRGICKMRFNHPHEGARLAMFYAVAWDISRKDEYRALWRKYVDEGLSNSMRMATQSPEEFEKGYGRWLMNYALLQMQTSLEVLYALAPSEGERMWVRAAMQRPAEIASVRALDVGSGNGQYLCSCAELSLAQTMTPGFAYEGKQRQILKGAIAAESFADKATSMRIVHLAAAWWRWRLTSGADRD